MSEENRPRKAGKARGASRIPKRLSAFALALAMFAGSAAFSQNSGLGPQIEVSVVEPAARLTYQGGTPVITGSVASLFAGSTFSAPIAIEDGGRANPAEDVLEFVKAFDEVRTRLAALGNSVGKKVTVGGRVVAAHDSALSVAAIDPRLVSAVLDAIDTVDVSDGGTDRPAPVLAPEQLAYARANAPVTVFETPVSGRYSDTELGCLTDAVYFEARGENYRGQVAVAQVVMNRVNHRLYPQTICGVVYEDQSRRNSCQFSFACDGIPERVYDKAAWAQAEEIAMKVTKGELYLTEVGNATHYHATYVYPRWAPRLAKVATIGLHTFYRFKRRG